MKNLLTAEECIALRAHIDTGTVVGLTPRIWQPIEVSDATGKAGCRGCGAKIAKDEQSIAFGFDPYAQDEAVVGTWGKLSRAYIHVECPTGGEGQTDDLTPLSGSE